MNGLVDEPDDRQVPLARFVVGDVADVQDREPVGRVLPGREAGGVDALLRRGWRGCVRRSPYRPSLPGNCARPLCPVTGPGAAPCGPDGASLAAVSTTFLHRRARPLHRPHPRHRRSPHRRSPRRHRRRLPPPGYVAYAIVADTPRRPATCPRVVDRHHHAHGHRRDRDRRSRRSSPPAWPRTPATILDGELSDDEFRDAIGPVNAAQLIDGVATIAMFVVTVIWMYRIATNVRALPARHVVEPPVRDLRLDAAAVRAVHHPVPRAARAVEGVGSDRPERHRGLAALRRQPLHLGVARAVRDRPDRPAAVLGRFVPRRWSGVGKPRFAGRQPRRIRRARSGRRPRSTVAAAVVWIVLVRQLTARHVRLTSER